MILEKTKDQRIHPRSVVDGHIEVNGGVPYQGGVLRDMSVGGAAIVYPQNLDPKGEPIRIDDEVLLIVRGRAHMPGRVARTFDGGFAVRFDWSIDIERDRFMQAEDN